MLTAARKLAEGTPSPRDFDRGDHRRLLKSDGAHRTGNCIVEITGRAVNNLLRDILHFTNDKAERLERSA